MFINSASNSDFTFYCIINKVPFRKYNIDFYFFKGLIYFLCYMLYSLLFRGLKGFIKNNKPTLVVGLLFFCDFLKKTTWCLINFN